MQSYTVSIFTVKKSTVKYVRISISLNYMYKYITWLSLMYLEIIS